MITTKSFDLFSRPLHGLRLGLGPIPSDESLGYDRGPRAGSPRGVVVNRPLRADSVEPTFWAKPAFAEIASRPLSRPSVVRPLTYDLRDSCGRAVSLPALDAYAQSRRLQPVLRASETAAPPASVPKAPPAEGVSVLSHSPQRHRETEKNSRASPCPI
jgi:hypothetical protein